MPHDGAAAHLSTIGRPLFRNPFDSEAFEWPRLALAAWCALAVAVAGIGFINGWLRPGKQSVYPIFSRAAMEWIAGHDLYTHVEAPFRYSPLAAILFVPFGLLPDALGGAIWRLVNVVVYGSALLWWSQSALPEKLTRNQRAFLFLLVIPLSLGSLHNGQSNALVAGLMLASVAAVTARLWTFSSALLAIACLFKVYPIALAALLILIYPRQMAWRFGLALGVGLAIPFVLQHPAYAWSQLDAWLHLLLHDDRGDMTLLRGYQNLSMLFRLCDRPICTLTYLSIQASAAVAIAGLCMAAKAARWAEKSLVTLALALACCWMTVLGSATESCTYLFLAPSLVWSLVEAYSEHAALGSRLSFSASYVLMIVAGMLMWFPWGVEMTTWGFLPWAGLLYFLTLVAQAVRKLASHDRYGDRQEELCCSGSRQTSDLNSGEFSYG